MGNEFPRRLCDPLPPVTAVLYYHWLAAGLHDKIISQGVGGLDTESTWEFVTHKVSHHTLGPKMEFKPPFTFWISRLYHKLMNNTMENIRVVITIFAVSCEVFHSLGTPRRKKEP